MPRTTHIRERILNLAIEDIDNGGEAAVRVNDLAAAAGVTVPTLYRHFGSRDGLIVAAQTKRFSETQLIDPGVFAAALSKCKTRDDLRRVLRKELMTHFDHDRWAVRATRINALGSGYARPDLLASLAFAQRQAALAIIAMLEPFQKNGLIRKNVDLAALAYWFMGQILGRTLIEMGDDPVAQKKWNEISIDAVMAVAFGDSPK